MKATVTTPESWKSVIEIEVPQADVAAAYTEKLRTYAKKATLPGFRVGKVPPKLIESRYKDALRAEVIEELVSKSYESACVENKINPVSEAKVLKVSAEENAPLTCTIETEIDPVIEIKGYDKLKVKAEKKKIKKAQIDEAIANIYDRMAEYKDVERASVKGDHVTIAYESVLVEGVVNTDIKAPTYPVEVGSSAIKEFDKAISAKSPGDTVTAEIKFPSDYPDTQVAGKATTITMKITKVSEKVLPVVNEEFLKKLGDFATEDDLRKRIEDDLLKRENEQAKSEAHTKAIDLLIEKNPFDVPPTRVERYLDEVFKDAEKYKRPGQPEVTREDVGRDYREAGMRALKRYRIIDFIANAEKIKPTQAEVDAKIVELAGMYNQPFDTLKAALRKNGAVNRIRAELREGKTLDFLIGEEIAPVETQTELLPEENETNKE